jgi:hypothetical protein
MRTSAQIQLSALEKATGMPDWVPSPGEYGLVPMQNGFMDIKPVPPDERPAGIEAGWTWGAQFGGSFEHFVGAAMAEDFSEHGALVFGSGGGNSFWGTQVQCADLTDLLYKRVLDPSPWALSDSYNTRYRNSDPDWRDYPDHHPVCGHNYTAIQSQPASWGNVGAKGALVRVANTGAVQMNAHRCDLASPAWQRFADKTFLHQGLAYYPAATRDDHRQCFYFTQGSQSGTSKHYVLSKDGVLTEAPGGTSVASTVSCIGYAPPPYDVVLAVGNQETHPIGIRVKRADDWNAQAYMNMVGMRPTFASTNGEHPEWCPELNCFLFWEGKTETLHECHPPATGVDPVTGPWTFVQRKIAKSVERPPTFVDNAPGGAWNKARWSRRLRALIYKPNAAELHIIKPVGV